ncbi:YheC/YheD family protein [Aquibacillus albus]|uniref:YheC/YheD family protein n=1 Tax=Aquibacillus albus TaxID=1168171 RepID=A0ABS2N582_9BACI|nr:YheC/YheD family protein [Aquibacillus albus]MBM7573296.1 hypothetical protein [Aquibacillus albus]
MNNYNIGNGTPINTNVYFDKNRLYFNKWEMYKLLAPYDFPFHIPYTNYFSQLTLNEFTYRKKSFYIKPVDTWSGIRITLVNPVNSGFVLKYPNGSGEFFPNHEMLTQYLTQQYTNTHAIIQDHAPILTFDNRAFDIRVHVQRDENGNWLHAGDLIRIGGNESIVSNLFSNGGGVVETDFVLKKLFPSFHANMIKENLATSALGIAHLLDYYYAFIDIGVDFGIDLEGELWLLEVNTNDRNGQPAYKLFKKLPNKSIYKQMVARDKRRKKIWKKKKIF